ncbi:J domain-containing protein [Aquabacterium soli]|uniref:J domain-containing protein n=1 Tax=Aquabacterium soli TaxID=2493092 RepID=UPI0013155B8F|nr:J domain-containing protein [Aquabacterium soli]
MNHYERLKVNPDAPIEVIRAAYRALAAKHHPDRHMQPGTSHGDMVALNAAYEVLADPTSRAAYDAELADAQAPAVVSEAGPASRLQNLWRTTMGFGGGDTSLPPQPAPDEPDDGRVDVHWQPPLPGNLTNPWLSKRRLVPLISVLGVLVLAVGIWWVRATVQQIEAEQTLSQHYGAQQAHAGGSPARDKQAPVVTMTDEELLAPPPPLPVQPSATASKHLLDGTPLTLRQETHLVDPLTLPSLPPHP